MGWHGVLLGGRHRPSCIDIRRGTETRSNLLDRTTAPAREDACRCKGAAGLDIRGCLGNPVSFHGPGSLRGKLPSPGHWSAITPTSPHYPQIHRALGRGFAQPDGPARRRQGSRKARGSKNIAGQNVRLAR